MTEVTLTFQQTEQPSIQVGDTAYYVDPSSSGGFQVGDQDNVTTIGVVTEVTTGTLISGGVSSETFVIKCNMNNDVTPPTTASFILFSKDNKVNMTSLLGYFGSAKFKNNSTEKAEMFATSCEINESSK
tara:strand:+ start:557 stop:943 length:387 start_codon:yes stop_codon:yes gene_type:complete